MGPDPGLGLVVDGAQVHIDELKGAEVAFHPGPTLVGGHHFRRSHLLGGHGGGDDVDPVKAALALMWSWSWVKAKEFWLMSRM